jgi:Fe-S-cluster containining protein
MNHQLKKEVHAAAGRADVREAVRDVYERLGREIEQRRPVCVASGRCCRFEEYGHRLFVTTMELAAFVHELGLVISPSPGTPGEGRGGGVIFKRSAEEEHAPTLTLPRSTGRGDKAGGCPFQVGKLCGVHAIRPFGCRIFFCDPTAQDWQQEQYERFHRELKALHERLGVAYFYMEWRMALAAVGLGLSEPDLSPQRMPL